jgi:hypothetical protein
MDITPWTQLKTLCFCFGTIMIAGLLGFAAGALMAENAADDDYSLTGLAFIPVWLLLEIYFALVVEVFGQYSKSVRIAAILAILVGFYSAWFALS